MAQAYRWVDEDGVVHFSDRPVEGAERIFLPEQNRGTRRVFAPPPAPTRNNDAAESQPEVFAYESIEIVAPAPEETLWNIESVLNVSLRVVPALRQGDQVRVYFDGDARVVNGTTFQIEEVYRGVHNIQVEIIDSTGKLMVRSLPNRFYVQQNSIG
jgi:hypothetical protein